MTVHLCRCGAPARFRVTDIPDEAPAAGLVVRGGGARFVRVVRDRVAVRCLCGDCLAASLLGGPWDTVEPIPAAVADDQVIDDEWGVAA